MWEGENGYWWGGNGEGACLVKSESYQKDIDWKALHMSKAKALR